MIYDTPYEAIVRDAIEGKDVVLFCDTPEQAMACHEHESFNDAIFIASDGSAVRLRA